MASYHKPGAIRLRPPREAAQQGAAGEPLKRPPERRRWAAQTEESVRSIVRFACERAPLTK